MESALLDLRQQDLRVQICHPISCPQLKNSPSFQRSTGHSEPRERLPRFRDTRGASCGEFCSIRRYEEIKSVSPRRSSQSVLGTRNSNALTTVSSMENTGRIRVRGVPVFVLNFIQLHSPPRVRSASKLAQRLLNVFRLLVQNTRIL